MGGVVPLFDVDLVVDFLGYGEERLGVALSDGVVFGVDGSQYATLFEHPPEQILRIDLIIDPLQPIELITDQIQRPRKHRPRIIQPLHRRHQHNLTPHPIRNFRLDRSTVSRWFALDHRKELVVLIVW